MIETMPIILKNSVNVKISYIIRTISLMAQFLRHFDKCLAIDYFSDTCMANIA